MSCYISSQENRFYAAVESGFGFAEPVTENDRFPALTLAARQTVRRPARKDKTGSRTFAGLPAGLRRETQFDVSTYMTSWDLERPEPSYGSLFQASLGGSPEVYSGGQVSALSGTQLEFSSGHGLAAGQGVSCGGEIRFVAAVVNSTTVILNAPFTADQGAGWPVDKTLTYRPARDLPSLSIYDHWSPAESVQRILVGAAVDQMRIGVNGDYHNFRFAGQACDLLDSSSFESGQGGLSQFPDEPEVTEMDHSIVPGNLGQAWLGNAPDQFFTLTEAVVLLNNGLDLRAREFGMDGPRCIAAGTRTVTTSFNLYAMPDSATAALYQAARQDSPTSVMFQLGQQTSQLFGVYLKSVMPEVPEFVDDETRLEWRFKNCRAQGTLDDEILVAFG